MIRVAAVFATMNRCETAVSCVMALAAQTVPPDLVVVADNVSGDGTADTLEELSKLPFRLIVHRMRENLGNAGGVEEAVEIAFSHQADAVWILDDDSIPDPTALEKLLEIPWQTKEVRHSIQIDPKTGDLTWPMQIHDERLGWMTVNSLLELHGKNSIPTRNNWTGSLIPREVHDLIGPVMGALFIRGEDEEYPWRMATFGINQTGVCTSILQHPGPTSLQKISFLGKSIYYESGLADWKLYYKVRNMLWLQIRKRGWMSMTALGMAYLWIIVRHDGWKKCPVFWQAASDGICGRLGRWRHHPF